MRPDACDALDPLKPGEVFLWFFNLLHSDVRCISSDPICLKAISAVIRTDKPLQIAMANCIFVSGGKITLVLPNYTFFCPYSLLLVCDTNGTDKEDVLDELLLSHGAVGDLSLLLPLFNSIAETHLQGTCNFLLELQCLFPALPS